MNNVYSFFEISDLNLKFPQLSLRISTAFSNIIWNLDNDNDFYFFIEKKKNSDAEIKASALSYRGSVKVSDGAVLDF